MTTPTPPADAEDEHHVHRRDDDETASERYTRQISELLAETRVAAVGVQVIVGFLLAVPFNAELEGLQRDAYVVAILAGIAATVAFLAPSVLHRAVLHRGQAPWLVATGSRLLLLGALASAVALGAVALLVGDRVLDGWVRFLPLGWVVAWVGVLWAIVPARRRRIVRR